LRKAELEHAYFSCDLFPFNCRESGLAPQRSSRRTGDAILNQQTGKMILHLSQRLINWVNNTDGALKCAATKAWRCPSNRHCRFEG
jgi:hypothetical protein